MKILFDFLKTITPQTSKGRMTLYIVGGVIVTALIITAGVTGNFDKLIGMVSDG